jgi:hypothetical protein
MSELSPAATAVLNAYMDNCGWLDGPLQKDYQCAAAVLRAAADEVVPLGYEDVWTDGKMLQYEKHDPIRERLLAIATELENQ